MLVARIKAISLTPKPDPIVLLAGGPGGSALFERNNAKGWNLERDVILVSQRGTLKADPFLNCPEIDAFFERMPHLVSTDAATVEQSGVATRACHDRLAGEGWDLSAYNSAENAADIADLRVALGIGEWNVYGISYGTSLALQLLHDHPEGIRSMVLNSVLPPQVNLVDELWPTAAEGYEALFDACAAEAACNGAFPNVRAEFTKLVNDLTKQPRTISIIDPATGQPAEMVVDGYKLADLAGPEGSLGNANARARIPSLVHNLAAGDGTEAAAALLAKKEAAGAAAGLTGYGLMFGVVCSEFVPFTNPEQATRRAKLALPNFPDPVLSLPPQIPTIFSDCKLWDVKPSGQPARQPVRSDVPVLLVSGSLDSVTPPSFARIVASTLPNARNLVFPGGGHGVAGYSPECFSTIMANFLNQPKDFDDSCLKSVRIPPFKTP